MFALPEPPITSRLSEGFWERCFRFFGHIFLISFLVFPDMEGQHDPLLGDEHILIGRRLRDNCARACVGKTKQPRPNSSSRSSVACSCPHRPQTPLGAYYYRTNFTAHVASTFRWQPRITARLAVRNFCHHLLCGGGRRELAQMLREWWYSGSARGDRWTDRYYSNAY